LLAVPGCGSLVEVDVQGIGVQLGVVGRVIEAYGHSIIGRLGLYQCVAGPPCVDTADVRCNGPLDGRVIDSDRRIREVCVHSMDGL
jgi:hypothetical protein